jgi:hypothetical protein
LYYLCLIFDIACDHPLPFVPLTYSCIKNNLCILYHFSRTSLCTRATSCFENIRLIPYV